MRVHPDGLVLPPITQERIELCQSVLIVSAVDLIGDGQVFIGVHVMERDGARLAIGDRVLQGLATENDQESGETQPYPARMRRNGKGISCAILTVTCQPMSNALAPNPPDKADASPSPW